MPFTFLAHQAAVLPLKLAKPRWFSGTALAIGSMAPDVQYFITLRPADDFHTLSAQFVVCLPATLVLTWLIQRVVVGPVARHLPDFGPLRVRDYGLLALRRPAALLKTSVSALIGSFSHIAWDGFTHQDGWAVERLPILQGSTTIFGHAAPIAQVMQLAGSVLGALITLSLLYHIGSRRLLERWYGELPRRAEVEPTRGARLSFWAPVFAGGLFGVCFRWVYASRAGASLRDTAVHSFFGLVGFGFAALVLICLLRSPKPSSGPSGSSGRLAA